MASFGRRAAAWICGMLVTLSACAGAERPNVVLVLFDDLGYGQPRPWAEDSEFPMPHIERLAREGKRFTDAHSASAVCTPTRYGLLTGRYPFRIGQYGVLTTYSPPIIPHERLTLPEMLQQCGYHTACFGKWHLGQVWEDGRPGRQDRVPIGARLTDGPLQAGFDRFCGFTHARNIGTIIDQDRVAAHVTAVENQPWIMRHAVEYLREGGEQDQPFFLYFPMCPPHTPIAPSDDYIGQSGAQDIVGNDPRYGDWILQGDAMLGGLLNLLDELDLAENTLVIATSDNGAERRAYPPLRASKRSIYEGGHRVPFVVRWPGRVAAGSECHATICLNDVFATLADLLEFDLPASAAEDSFSLLPLLLDSDTENETEAARSSASDAEPRRLTVHQSIRGDLAIRSGDWKLVLHRKGETELFHLGRDLSETTDLSEPEPDRVAALQSAFRTLIDSGRSSAGPQQQNEHAVRLEQLAPR